MLSSLTYSASLEWAPKPLKTKAAVIEGFGLSGFGAHSNDAEYVKLESIVPRLYLTTRMIMDVSQDKVK